jgi:hypothetical protein
MRKAPWGWALCGLLFSAGPLHAQPKPIGLVKTVSGDATVLRGGKAVTAVPGLALFQGDVLRTGSPGTVGVILHDDTTLSLGAGSEVHLAEFVFEPAEGKLGFVLRLTRGVLGFVSGKIAKLAPEATRVETPVATLGIRGTRLAARIAR